MNRVAKFSKVSFEQFYNDFCDTFFENCDKPSKECVKGIYDEIKVKSDKYIRLDFNQVKSYDFKEKVHISNREDALNLLMMTPHYYHIKKEKRGVLDTLQGLDITIDIKVTVYALS